MAKRRTKKKKKTAKRASARTAAKRKAPARRKSFRYTSTPKPVTKSQIAGALAEKHELPRKVVNGLLETLFEEIVPAELKKHKKVTLNGMVKFTERKRPARKARKGVNPFTGEEMMFKAKPASKTVKAVALKKLKDMV